MAAPDAFPDDNLDEEKSPVSGEQIGAAMAALKATGDGGASWFFWIAGLSLVNTVIAHSGGNTHFIVGLAVTAIADAIAYEVGKEEPGIATALMIGAIGFSVVISIALVACGWLSRKRILWIFGGGMFLYLLDGLLYLLLGDLLSAGFHGYALFSMFQGFNAYRKLNQFETALANSPPAEGHSSDQNPEVKSDRDLGFETT